MKFLIPWILMHKPISSSIIFWNNQGFRKVLTWTCSWLIYAFCEDLFCDDERVTQIIHSWLITPHQKIWLFSSFTLPRKITKLDCLRIAHTAFPCKKCCKNAAYIEKCHFKLTSYIEFHKHQKGTGKEPKIFSNWFWAR